MQNASLRLHSPVRRGYALQDCAEIYGEELERAVTRKDHADVAQLAGRPVRLRFRLHDADLFFFVLRD